MMSQFHSGIFTKINFLRNLAVDMYNIQSISKMFHFCTKNQKKMKRNKGSENFRLQVWSSNLLNCVILISYRDVGTNFLLDNKYNSADNLRKPQVINTHVNLYLQPHCILPAEPFTCGCRRQFYQSYFYSVCF